MHFLIFIIEGTYIGTYGLDLQILQKKSPDVFTEKNLAILVLKIKHCPQTIGEWFLCAFSTS